MDKEIFKRNTLPNNESTYSTRPSFDQAQNIYIINSRNNSNNPNSLIQFLVNKVNTMESQMNNIKNQMNIMQISHKNQMNYMKNQMIDMQISHKNQMNIMQANNLFQMDKIRKNNKIQEKKYQMKIIYLQNNLQKLRQDQIKQENEINRINNKIEEFSNSYERDFNKVKIELKDIKNKSNRYQN
jgi:hypothetical protein